MNACLVQTAGTTFVIHVCRGVHKKNKCRRPRQPGQHGSAVGFGVVNILHPQYPSLARPDRMVTILFRVPRGVSTPRGKRAPPLHRFTLSVIGEPGIQLVPSADSAREPPDSRAERALLSTSGHGQCARSLSERSVRGPLGAISQFCLRTAGPAGGCAVAPATSGRFHAGSYADLHELPWLYRCSDTGCQSVCEWWGVLAHGVGPASE